MHIREFSAICEEFWNGYLSAVKGLLNLGRIRSSYVNPVPSYPQSLLITQLPDHFVMELVGGRRSYRPLTVRRHVLRSADLYFGQFQHASDVRGMFDLTNSHHNLFVGLVVITARTQDELNRRFPGIIPQPSATLLWVGSDDVIGVKLGPATSFVSLVDCLLVNSLNQAVRIRNLQVCSFVRQDSSSAEWRDYLRQQFPLHGSIVAFKLLPNSQAEIIRRAAQFANVYLQTGLRETSIGKFLEEHTDIITTALGAHSLISEPYIEWQVGSPDPAETAINPDLFVVNANGTASIFDLKLPLLERKSITRGSRRRRRFIEPVNEGIAQLAHYRDFLSIPENRSYAEQKFGVRFSDPKMGLIVGNYENVTEAHIEEASRQLSDAFVFYDYDTLLQSYVAGSGVRVQEGATQTTSAGDG